MTPSRAWQFNLVAAFFLLVGLAILLAVATYDIPDSYSSDSTNGSEDPSLTFPRNLLGSPGARLAYFLISTLGIAVYVFLGAWFVLVGGLYRRRDWLCWVVRLLGWILLAPCVAVLAQLWSQPSSTSLGGRLGVYLVYLLQAHLQPILQPILFCFVFVVALACSSDLASGWLLRWGRRLALGLVLEWTLRWGLILSGILLYRLYRSLLLLLAVGRLLLGRKRSKAPALTQPAVSKTPSGTVIRRPRSAAANAASSAKSSSADSSHNGHKNEKGEKPEQHVAENKLDRLDLPSLKLLEEPRAISKTELEQHLRERGHLLEKTFADFGLRVRVVGVHTGPVITQFEVALESGIRLRKVTTLANDLALCLKVPGVRIVAPLPGRNTIGIELPNDRRAEVRLKEVILGAGDSSAGMKLPLYLGKDVEGKPMVYDLADMPHLLIAGSTGTGKSVCMNAVITSVLMTRSPEEVRMVMIDPKGGVELNQYGRLPHMMHPVIEDMKKAGGILAWAVDKMEERYDLLRRARVRNIAGYNELGSEVLRRIQPADEEERQRIPLRLPYVIIFVDEMADLILLLKKEVEGHIIRLAQKSRAAGIHLIVATQRPTVDVITGLIKSNLPARICFKVVNKSDSRVVLDEIGAEKLLGKGDLLFLRPGTSSLIRGQGAYVSDTEINRVVEQLEGETCYEAELLQLDVSTNEDKTLEERLETRDPVYRQAVEVVIREGRGSVSLLQRSLGIGYGRAARLIDFMADDGIVGAYNGSNAREVLYTPEQWASWMVSQEG